MEPGKSELDAGFANLLDYPLSQTLHAGLADVPRCNRELIASQPDDEVVLSRERLERLGDGAKNLVPAWQAVKRVCLLEVVEVDQQQAQRIASASAAVESREQVGQRPTVGEAGQRVL